MPDSLEASTSAGMDRRRRQVGLILAPALFLICWFLPFEGLSPSAHRLLAILAAVVVLWITEAVALPVTALIGAALCIVLGVGTAREVFASFADPIIFVYLGGFMIAQAMMDQGLSRRIACSILGLRGMGGSGGRLILVFGVISALISMWLSNTATTAMLMPIALSVLTEIAGQESARTGKPVLASQLPLSAGVMLAIAYGASIGGLATPVGTPPNLIGRRLIETAGDTRISFFTWMAMGIPLSGLMLAMLLTRLRRFARMQERAGGSAPRLDSLTLPSMGALSRGEKNVLAGFGLTVFLWVGPGFLEVVLPANSAINEWFRARIPESVAALLGAGLLFLLPVNLREARFTLSWESAARIDWGTIVLFGGGLAMGGLMFSTGLAKGVGEGAANLLGWRSAAGLTVVFGVVALLITEATSNVATTNMLVPVAIAVAEASGVNPLQPALAACLASSLGYMLPVATPPNAIVYGSGCVPLKHMLREGLFLDLAGLFAVLLIVLFWVPVVFSLP